MTFLCVEGILRTKRANICIKKLYLPENRKNCKLRIIMQLIDIILCIISAVLVSSYASKSEQACTGSSLNSFDAASCNKTRVVLVLDRYELSDVFRLGWIIMYRCKRKTKNRLCMSPCCFKFYTEVTKACGNTYCAVHSLKTWCIVLYS
jgi:hypothetical protein